MRSIKIADFLPIAEAISKNDSNFLVPVALSRLFNRAIQTRIELTQWFIRKAVDSEKESNERHHYFISVLENALLIL
jgi:site-specific recombinase XerC